MNILFLTTVLPSGRYGGGEIWSQNIVDALRAANAAVTVVGYDRRGAGAVAGEVAVTSRTVETARNPLAALRWGMEALLRSRPYTVQKWAGAEYRTAVRKLFGEQDWDLAVVDHAGMAWMHSEIGRLPFVHVAHQAESSLYAQHAASGSCLALAHRREARLVRETEARLARHAVQVWTLSEQDGHYFRKLGAQSVRALPVAGRPGWEAVSSRTANDADLALLGSWTWKPNREGLVWFLTEVVPLLPKTWIIKVAGKYVARGLPRPDNVRFVGVVPDAFDFLRGAKRIAVPSLSSVGVPIKLLDAIAVGSPVVTTQAALARIGDAPHHVVAAADAMEFARALTEAHAAGAGGHWARKRQEALRDGVAEALASLEGRRAAAH